MNVMEQVADTAADAFLSRLSKLGAENVFASSGADFDSIIEACARNVTGAREFPEVIAVPRAGAVIMAQGYDRP